MRSSTLFLLITAGMAGGAVACDEVSLPTATPGEEFQTALSGANEVPAVTTPATGAARFAVMLDTFLAFRLDVAAIDTTMAAHIHKGAAGVADSVIATLFTGLPTCNSNTQGSPSCRVGFTGLLVQGQLKPSQLPVAFGAAPRARLDSLLRLLRTGNAYVDVHTKRNAGCEIRGQVQPL